MIEILTETTEKELNPYLLTETEIKKRGGVIAVFVEWVKANPQIVEQVKKEIAEEDTEQGFRK
jgi:hypothetical protein